MLAVQRLEPNFVLEEFGHMESEIMSRAVLNANIICAVGGGKSPR